MCVQKKKKKKSFFFIILLFYLKYFLYEKLFSFLRFFFKTALIRAEMLEETISVFPL